MDDHPWYARRGFVASAVFLALLVVVGAAVALTGGGSDHPDTTSARAAIHGRAVDTGGSVCALPRGSQEPVVGPPDARWTLLGTIAAPTVANIGPGIVDGHDRRCYAHSPEGALVAAANLLPLAGYANGPTSVAHFLPGRTRDVYSKQPAPPVDPSLRVQLAGFRDQVVGPDAVDVTLAYRSNVNGVVVSITWPMRWRDGDWRAQLGSLQQPFTVDGPVTLDNTWIRWGGA